VGAAARAAGAEGEADFAGGEVEGCHRSDCGLEGGGWVSGGTSRLMWKPCW
jgi:hypothetical protein